MIEPLEKAASKQKKLHKRSDFMREAHFMFP